MARRRLEHPALNRFQRKCIISNQAMISGDDAQPDNAAIAELVARRWQEDRRKPTLHMRNRGAGLRASWLLHCEYGDLILHWSACNARDR